MRIELPEYVALALEKLETSGFEAYVVGGCVRDAYLNKTPLDWDITTDAKPSEIAEVFKGFKVIETGIAHGTLTVLVSGNPVEITTYRVDGEYEDNRHPKEVRFTKSLREDLARRDFTVNALAYNPKTGVVDAFDGIQDLNNKMIRCVGDPDKRFSEDALRIMRALRFASCLGFTIDTETSKSLRENSILLKNVSAERITAELLKLLCGDNVTQILIEYRSVFAVIIPELAPAFDFDQNNKHHIYNVYDHIAHAVGSSAPDSEVRLALLLHDIGKPACYTEDENGVGHFYGHGNISAEIAANVLSRMRLSSDMYQTVFTLVKYHDIPIEPDRKIVKRRLNKFGEEILRKLLLVKTGDGLAHNPEYVRASDEMEAVNQIVDDVIRSGDCFSVKALAINGKDLLNLGFASGPLIGEVLTKMLEKVIDGSLNNNREELINYAFKFMRKEEGNGTEKN